jgi:hypothetical protein
LAQLHRPFFLHFSPFHVFLPPKIRLLLLAASEGHFSVGKRSTLNSCQMVVNLVNEDVRKCSL